MQTPVEFQSPSLPSLGPIAEIDRPSQINRPINAFIVSTSVVKRLAGIQQKMAEDCATKAGFADASFEMTGTDDLIRTEVDNLKFRSDLWGFFDSEHASGSGYHYATTLQPTESGFSADIPEEVGLSCSTSSFAGLPGGRGWDEFIAMTPLPEGGPAAPTTDERFTTVVQSWKQCMTARGFNYSDPQASLSDPRWQTPNPSPEEVATAVADIDCKLETNLVGVGVAVQSAYDAQYIEKNTSALIALKQDIDEFLRANPGS